MFNSFFVRLLWRSYNWLLRLVFVSSAVVAVFIAIAIIVLRYWIFPDIEQYHDRIAASLAGAIGSPVSVGKIEGNWQGIYPHLKLSDIRILNEQQQPALVLPHIESNVSWMTLLTAELRFASMEIVRPELLVRRDTQGRFFIGGVKLSNQGGDGILADWLLRQSRIVVRNALIVWVDEKRVAPPLVLQKVELRIENLFNHHRFALSAVPPEELANPLDVRGDFSGASFADLNQWRGQLFTRLDYTDVTAWRPWLDLPGQFSRGRGALRGWLDVEAGKVIGVVADVELYDVVTKLSDDVPEMMAINLHGRTAWHDMADGMEISTKHLSMRLLNGVELQPTDLYFFMAEESDQKTARGAIHVNQLQLESFTSLAEFFPLQVDLRERLDAYSPKGKVTNLDVQWQGDLSKPDSYQVKGHFENIALNQVGKIPGFSGLTADVTGNQDSGHLSISARQLVVDAPGVMREPLSFDTLTGQAGWRHKDQELLITVDNIAVVNDDLAGNLYGSYQTQAGTRGILDLTGKLTRGDIRSAARYTPLVALDMTGNEWLNGALLAGHTEDFRIRIKGNLSDFPLDGTKNTLFKIGGHARDAVMEFDKSWPRIENISGEFLINGNKLEVKAPFANMAGAGLQNVTVTLPDMMGKELQLEISGEAVAPSNVFLQFIQKSPVRGYIGGMTDGMRASGNGHLDLKLLIPLSDSNEVHAQVDMSEANAMQGEPDSQPVKVAGTVSVQDSDIDIGGGVPLLSHTHGSLSFTETGIKASGIQTEMLGGNATINVQSEDDGVVRANLRGVCNLNKFRDRKSYPLLNYLQGSAAWSAEVIVAQESAKVTVNSDLKGISSGIPKPFNKTSDEMMPIRFEKSHVKSGQDIISAQLGELLSVRLARRDENGAMIIKRGTINFGSPAMASSDVKWPGKDGVWITGMLHELSMQGWEGLVSHSEKSGVSLPISRVDLNIEKITGFGKVVNGVHLKGSKRADGLAAQLSGKMVNGEMAWLPRGYEKGGKVSAQFRVLQLDDVIASSEPVSESTLASLPDNIRQMDPTEQGVKLSPGKLPALDIAIENLQLKGRQIGRFELVGHPEGPDWLLRRLRLTNPDGSLMGDGVWNVDGESRTNLLMDISDAGNILDRSGYPNTVKGGSVRLEADLTWVGAPYEFNKATLYGSFKLESGKGRFLKMNPGAGKLLSILSLQALPRHITLDFTDVFSEGFQFDNIKGSATINKGVIDTQDFQIDGSSAKVTLKGSVDLNDETQNMRVRVLPTVGDTVSLGVAFAAGPAVGVGTLILNKVLGNPLDKLVSFEYNVSGTWANPNVVKVGSAPASAQENNLVE